MGTPEALRRCPQCRADLEKTKAALRDIAELSFCLECQFPLMLVAGKYRIRKLLAQGGFGKVYLAQHVHLQRDSDRVLKVLDQDVFAIKGMESRFRREVQVTGALSQLNEHIVRIYDDFGEIPKLGHFYVMEHLQGQPLTSLVRNSKKLPSLKLCFHIFSQLCDAMAAAHHEEVVHRDLKPDNIFLIERKGDPYFVKVLDFGIAKPMDKEALQTTQMTQGTLGTPPYMSPEQCNDEALDHRADIYAMGIILYELYVGHTPFFSKQNPRSALRILQDHLLTSPPSIRTLRPDREIPEAIEEIVMQALSKRADDRFRSAMEFQRALAGAYLQSGLELPKDPDAIERHSWSQEQHAVRSSSPQWPVADSTSFPQKNRPHIDGREGEFAQLDSAAQPFLHSGLAEHTGERLQAHHALQHPSQLQHNTDQQPIPNALPEHSKEIHHDSSQYNVVPEHFVSYDSARYDIACLGAEEEYEEDDEFEDFETYRSQFLVQKAIRPLLIVLALVVGGGLWAILIIASWNEQKQTRAQLLPQVGAVCGNTHSSWRPGTVRLLFIPLLSNNTRRPTEPKAAKRFDRLMRLQRKNLQGIRETAGLLGRSILTIHESALGFDQPDPVHNRARATMYGKLCHADIVFSGGWLTAGQASTSVRSGSGKGNTMEWLRLFTTYTGKPLKARIGKRTIHLGEPSNIDELVGTSKMIWPHIRIRHFLRGMTLLRAGNAAVGSRHLGDYLMHQALSALRKADVLQPTEWPKLQKTHLRNFRKREEVLIPEGNFWMGKQEKAKVEYLSAYWIDRYEVSREDYAICVLSGKCPSIRNFMSSSWALPRDRITRKAAQTYCEADGKDLPTEKQWVKAARGGVSIRGKQNPFAKRKYPWGNQAYSCKRTHVLRCYRALVEGDLVGVMLSVRRKLNGVSPYGVHHMIGNASELIKNGTIKGGDGYGPIQTISWKSHMDQRSGLSWVGFRCARSAQ